MSQARREKNRVGLFAITAALSWACALCIVCRAEQGLAETTDPTALGNHPWVAASSADGLCSEQPPAFFSYEFLARTLYANDQRIAFTGNESTFAVEAQLRCRAAHQLGDWNLGLFGELFLTQPFDRNLLADYPLRESFRNNFLIEPLEISQLILFAERNGWRVQVGRFETPFGRYWAPVFLNALTDVPFIRSESILFRETGVALRRVCGPMQCEVALTNGGLNRDTNSSKAVIGRVGYVNDHWVVGTSVKWHDGIGSEGQKEFNRHVGIDLKFAVTPELSLVSEMIYDQYGLRRPGTALDEITWGRSLYNRQLNNGLHRPISGWGYYAAALWQTSKIQAMAGYGEFYPQAIGDRIHDTVTRQLLVKSKWRFDKHVSAFISVILENPVADAQGGQTRRGVFLIVGGEYGW